MKSGDIMPTGFERLELVEDRDRFRLSQEEVLVAGRGE